MSHFPCRFCCWWSILCASIRYSKNIEFSRVHKSSVLEFLIFICYLLFSLGFISHFMKFDRFELTNAFYAHHRLYIEIHINHHKRIRCLCTRRRMAIIIILNKCECERERAQASTHFSLLTSSSLRIVERNFWRDLFNKQRERERDFWNSIFRHRPFVTFIVLNVWLQTHTWLFIFFKNPFQFWPNWLVFRGIHTMRLSRSFV